MANEGPLKVAGVIVCLFLFVFFLATPKIGRDPTPITQILLSTVLLVLGYWYYRFTEIASKKMLGVLAIVAGVVSNWFEIPKFAKDGVDRPERLLFVGAALVLIAHGFKQLKKAQLIKDRQKEMSTSTPQPNESSEVK